jgi:signal transduction histidine kinase
MGDEARDPGPALRDEARLAALRRTGLLDSPPEEAFDRLARLVCRLLGAPCALVSLVGADRQFFKSAVGLPQPWLLRRGTSLLHSLCQHVVAAGEPLLVRDASTHPITAGSLAVPELGVMAYLGMPLATPDGQVLGALCAIDTQPREWRPEDAAALRDLAAVTMGEVALRTLGLELERRLGVETGARAAAEARARRLEALRRLADEAAHELAGLLQAAQSGARLAAARLGRDEEAARALLGLVEDAARRGGLLARRLLAFAPRGELRAGRVDAAALLRRLEGGLAAAGGPGDPPPRLRLEVEPGLPPVLADPRELEAVLLGLAAAACGAMPGGGTLTVGARAEEVAAGGAAAHPAGLAPGRYLRLAVGDTGTGAGPPAAWPGAGAEADLALARLFAEELGGGLVRQADPGAGTTVVLWLPAAAGEPAEDDGGPAGAPREGPAARDPAGP